MDRSCLSLTLRRVSLCCIDLLYCFWGAKGGEQWHLQPLLYLLSLAPSIKYSNHSVRSPQRSLGGGGQVSPSPAPLHPCSTLLQVRKRQSHFSRQSAHHFSGTHHHFAPSWIHSLRKQGKRRPNSTSCSSVLQDPADSSIAQLSCCFLAAPCLPWAPLNQAC